MVHSIRRAARVLLLFGVVIVLIALMLAGCGRDAPAPAASEETPSAAPVAAIEASPTPVPEQPTPTAAPLPTTVEEVFARVEETLRGQDGIYYVVITAAQDAGEYSYDGTIERWVDARRNVMREEREGWSRVDDWGGRSTGLIADGTWYVREVNGEIWSGTAPTCYGASHAISAVLDCQVPLETFVEYGLFDGRAAVVLVAQGEGGGSDSNIVYTSRMYLDASTLLPIAHEMDGEIDYGEVADFIYRATYTHEFVASDSLADDFFDPAAIGYTPWAVMAPIDDATGDVTVYWLGLEFAPGGDLPELILDRVEFEEWDRLEYTLSLQYRGVEPDNWAFAIIHFRGHKVREASIMRTKRDYWQRLPCFAEEQITLAEGQATIFMAYSPGGFEESEEGVETPVAEVDCEEVEFNAFGAVAVLGETVWEIQAPILIDTLELSAYESHAGMEAVLRGLTRYEPR
jgi:hypothetical protein